MYLVSLFWDQGVSVKQNFLFMYVVTVPFRGKDYPEGLGVRSKDLDV